MRATVIGINYAPEPTGIAPYTTGAADGLTAGGHQVLAITGYPHYPSWRIAAGYTGWQHKEVIHGTRVLRLRHPVFAHGGVVGRSLMEVAFGARAVASNWFSPDVVLAVTPALLSTAAVVARARFTRRPIVVWVQDIYTLSAAETGAAAKVSKAIRWVESWTLQKATRVVVIHDRFAKFVTAELGVDPASVDVVRNWTHLNQTSTRSPQTRAAHGWDDDDLIVLHAGNMGAKQNLESVVRASQLAAQRKSRVHFVLLGDGHRRAALEEMGPNANLQFIDPLDDAEFASALASADILLVNELPGMTEMSVPSKLTSYFNTGLPVLAAVDSGSVTADEISSSHGGLHVDPDDPAALLDAAERLGTDPQLSGKLGAAGSRYRRKVLTAEAAITALTASLERAQSQQRAQSQR
jgi:colanic acid biosynthesis glycosyl transferase WcaI